MTMMMRKAAVRSMVQAPASVVDFDATHPSTDDAGLACGAGISGGARSNAACARGAAGIGR